MSEGAPDAEARVEALERALSAVKARLQGLESLVAELMVAGLGPPSATEPQPKLASTKKRGLNEGGRVLLLVLGDRVLGLPLDHVEEVVRNARLTPLVEARRAVDGLLNLRGASLPVVCLRTAFGLEPEARDLDARIVVLQAGERRLGLKVDAVRAVERIERGAVEHPALTDHPCLSGVVTGKRALLLLDPSPLFAALEEELTLPLPNFELETEQEKELNPAEGEPLRDDPAEEQA